MPFQSRTSARKLVSVDTDKLIDAWRESPGNFVEPGNSNEIGNRIHDFGESFNGSRGLVPGMFKVIASMDFI